MAVSHVAARAADRWCDVVVQLSLDRFPDIEDVLMAYLSAIAPTDTVVPPKGVDGIEIARVGGTDDGITDYPRVEITCYAEDRNTCKNMAEDVRQAMQNDVIRANPIEYDDGQLAWSVQIDRSDTDTPAENVGYKNPERRRKPAFYRLALRRPRTPPQAIG